MSALLFLLSYVFGVLFHNIIHELGHAITVWVQGGTVTGFYFHPFNSSYNSSSYVPNHLLLYAGGAFFGLPITIIFMLIALKYRSSLLFPFIISGAYGFCTTGTWMLKALISPEITSDYTYMIELGTPGLVLLIVGIIYITFGIFVRIFFLPLAGIDYKTNYETRFIIYFTGILPWYILQALFNLFVNDFPLVSLIYFLIPIILFLVFEVYISLPLQRKFKVFKQIPRQQIKIHHNIAILVGAVILYVIVIIVNQYFPLQT